MIRALLTRSVKRLELHGVQIPQRPTAFELVVSDGQSEVPTSWNERPLMALNELPEKWEFELCVLRGLPI